MDPNSTFFAGVQRGIEKHAVDGEEQQPGMLQRVGAGLGSAAGAARSALGKVPGAVAGAPAAAGNIMGSLGTAAKVMIPASVLAYMFGRGLRRTTTEDPNEAERRRLLQAMYGSNPTGY